MVAGRQKTLTFGVYPAVSLAQARRRRDEARKALAEGIDPGQAKIEARAAKETEMANTFETMAREWLKKVSKSRSASTPDKVTAWLEHDVFPFVGQMPVATMKARDILKVVQQMEARGAIDSAHRVKQVCGQVFRFGVALDVVERDITVDLKDALAPVPRTNYAALTEPKEVGALMRAIFDYSGSPAATAALKLAPLQFVRLLTFHRNGVQNPLVKQHPHTDAPEFASAE